MNKLSKDKRDKLILICMGAVGLAGILYTFVLGAQKERLLTLNSQITSAREKLSKAERLLRSADGVELNLAENKRYVEKQQEDMAPQGQYYYWFLKHLDQFRQERKLETSFIVDITQPDFIEAGLLPKFPYEAASFGVRLHGRFHEIGSFVAELENRFPFFRVANLRMAPVGAGIISTPPGQQFEAAAGQTGRQLIAELRVVTLIKPGNT